MKKRKGFWGFFGFVSISLKITLGFIAIYIFFFFNAANTIFTVRNGAAQIAEFGEVINPALDKLNAFRQMVLESQIYTFAWVHQPSEKTPEDREALREIHLNFASFRNDTEKLMKRWKGDQLQVAMDSALAQFELVIRDQQTIMEKLDENEDYFDGVTVLAAEKILDNRVVPLSKQIIEKINFITVQKNRDRTQSQSSLLQNFQSLVQFNLIMAVVLIFVGFIVTWWTRRQIVRPIKYINSVFIKLGSGEVPDDKHYPFNNDEIGEMAESADKLVHSLKEISIFAEKIGNGDYAARYQPLSEKDILGNALIEMRNNLAKVAEEEQKRKWSTEGQVLFSEILKENPEDIPQIADQVISELVRYLKANQGGLFVVAQEDNDLQSNGQEPYMSLAACYAWDKKKFLEQKVYIGDGLAGQAWQEKGSIYLDEVPEGYVQITSGLGEANPRSVLIVPLLHNEEVYGVVEIASFREFQPYEIDFVEKIAESIAATIASVRINERTRRLLAESTLMTEQMKSQEEEMRMNMEALQNAQEHSERSQREAKAKEYLLEATSIVLQTNRQFIIQSFNSLAEEKLRYDALEFEGMAIEFLFQHYEKIEKGMELLKKGGHWQDFLFLKDKHNQRIFVKVSASAIRNDQDEIARYLFILDDITDAKS
ncbi:MAG: GAF domain-containing protein [Microscillaceae bacterium]|nr:GAF domain-containing protein [Microscillaceae bacterium]